MHSVPPLVWDNAIAKKAESWIEGRASAGSFKSDEGKGIMIAGQDLAFGYTTGLDVAKYWYCGIECTEPYGIASNSSGSLSQRSMINRYAQVVWKSSRKIGC